MDNNIPKALQSSTDPNQISSRVTGLVVASSSIIVFLSAHFLRVQLSASDVITLGSELGAIAGAIWTIKGIVIALIMKFSKKSA